MGEPRPPQPGEPPLELAVLRLLQPGLGVVCGRRLAGVWRAGPGPLGRVCLAADPARCEMVGSGGADLRKGLAMSVGKCESRGFQF